MLNLLFQHPIKKQIDQYITWKALRYPTTASSHERVLKSFSRYAKLRCAKNIDQELINRYLSTLNAQYHKQQFLHVLRQFTRYWYNMGLLTKRFTTLVDSDTVLGILEDVSPTMHIDQVRRVQNLKKPIEDGGNGMSLRQIKLHMETEDCKVYHLRQIQRWAKYDLPKVIPR